MKKGSIICIIAIIIIVIGACLLFIKGINGENELSIITLDINPSIEMTIRKNRVESVKALNSDADIIIVGLEGKTLQESFDTVIKNAKDHNLVNDGNVTIILGTEKNDKKIENTLKDACNKNEVNANIIVPKITEEAKNEAKAHNISAAKAAYIMEVIEENKNLHFEDMVNKSSKELNEIKQSGKYCDDGYTLFGDFCEKLIKEEKPQEGKTCKEGYIDIKGICYKTSPTSEEAYCKDGLTLKNGKCVGNAKTIANAKCSTGTYNSNLKKCEVLNLVGDATKTCNGGEPGDHLMSNGRCSRAKWAHDDNTCEGNDVFINDSNGGPNAGWCYTPTGDYDAIYKCSNNQTLKDGKCYETSTTEPSFSCSSGKLEDKMCVGEVSKNPEYRMICGNGLTLYNNNICVDYSDTKDYVIGYVCEKDARLENNVCKYYEQVAPKES